MRDSDALQEGGFPADTALLCPSPNRRKAAGILRQRLFCILVSLGKGTRKGRLMRHNFIKAAARVKQPAWEPPRLPFPIAASRAGKRGEQTPPGSRRRETSASPGHFSFPLFLVATWPRAAVRLRREKLCTGKERSSWAWCSCKRVRSAWPCPASQTHKAIADRYGLTGQTVSDILCCNSNS